MKQTLDENSIHQLVAYRIKRAHETLQDIPAQTHDGVKQMLGLHFALTGKIDRNEAKFYSQLFNDRMSGDYDDFMFFDHEMLQELRPKAEAFITTIENLL